ncbi:MAG: hypothetical protein FJ272_04850 [Planctomycetes bacterium]|nr:hypothetical protein [Planctomycetota bacterium]
MIAEPGEQATAIASIRVTGGSVEGDVNVVGKVGGITVQGYGSEDEGGFTSDEFTASGIGNVSVVNGNFTASLVSTTTIGSIAVRAGAIGATLTAYTGIGSITLTVVTHNAKVRSWWEDYGEGEGEWQYEVEEGYAVGGPLEVEISLGASDPDLGRPINPRAKLGSITGVGADVTVNGEVPFAPEQARIVSRQISYVETYEEEETESGGTVRKPARAYIGGQATNNLTQITSGG